MTAVEKNINDRTVIIIAGPTAVGKTAIAIKLAQYFNTSIISADSRQCYKEISIGTAKPSPEELNAVRHYFIDSFPVTEHITAAGYERLALGYLDEIFAGHQVAVVCGGTGLYLKALSEGLDDMPAVNTELEEAVNEEYKTKGVKWLQEEVAKQDPIFYDQGEKDNPARLLRALVFKLSTGESILNYRTGRQKQRNFRMFKIVLELPREVLYERIDQRVDQMMKDGLLDEAKAMYSYRHLKNLQTVGYTELFQFFDGRYSLEEAVEKIKQHTRNYAKRQVTWFKKEKDAVYMTASDENIIERMVQLYEQSI